MDNKKKTTLSDVAKLAKVSRATVSYVLNNVSGQKIPMETQQRIREAAKQLNYEANPFALALKSRSIKTIALVIKQLSDPVIVHMISSIEKAAYREGYNVVLINLESKEESEFHHTSFLFEPLIDGVIFVYPDNTDRGLIHAMKQRRDVPIVIIGNEFEGISTHLVLFDFYKAGQLLGQQLLNYGHKKILMISDPMNPRKKDRLIGLQDTLNTENIPVELVPFEYTLSSELSLHELASFEKAFETTMQLEEKIDSFTCVIGMTETITMGIMSALHSLNIDVPNRISVSGFGGATETIRSLLLKPKLTMVAQPINEIGRSSFAILLAAMNESTPKLEKIVHQPQLLIRESLRPLK